MNNKFKSVLKIFFIFLPWLLGGLFFKYNPDFYNNLSLPAFTLKPKIISIIWIIIFIFTSISIYKVSKKINILKSNDYMYILITNYLANQLFPFVFFNLKSPFLGFIITIIVVISTLFLFFETKKIDKKASYYLFPYLIYNIYAFILSFAVYIMNF